MSALLLLLENLLFPLGALAVVLRFLFSPRRRLLFSLSDELSERSGGVSAETRRNLEGGPVLWVHAASAGEVMAVSGLLKRIKSQDSPPRILLTCTTISGRDKALGLKDVDAAALAPLDCYPAVARFLNAVKPRALILGETELWPQAIALASSRRIAIALVNGRISPKSFRQYRWLGAGLRPFLSRISRLAVQTPADAERFIALGAAPGSVRVVGNIKYDLLPSDLKDPEIARELAARGFAEAPIWVAGSTHPGEDEAAIAALQLLRARFPNLKLILAPRHLERCPEVASLLRKANVDFRNWTEPAAPTDCILVDRFGVLAKLYPFARARFIGGSLAPAGGHNSIEAAAAGSPVIFGPHTNNIAEVATLLISAGCGFRIERPEELVDILGKLLDDPSRRDELGRLARMTAEGLTGALDKTLTHISVVLVP